MKHSIRYIQSNYSQQGKGESILILRGMEVREYQYSIRRFDSLLMGMNSTSHKWAQVESYNTISFCREYPNS